MPIKCEICGSKLKSTQRLKRAIEADDGYLIICIGCRTHNKHLLGDEMRCTAIRNKGKKCLLFRFSKNSDLCRYHWREKDV